MGAWPRARPARQRPRCNLLGALRFARCCGREWRGRAGGGAGPLRGPDHSARPGVPRACRRRRSPLLRPRRCWGKASRLRALVLGVLPSLTPTHRVQKERRGGAERGHPSGWKECARPRRPRPPRRGGRGAGAARACGGGGVCGPVFGQLSTLGEKNICLKVQKKKWGWGGKELKKNSKA